MDTEVGLKKVHVFETLQAYEDYIAVTPIANTDVVLIGEYVLTGPDLDWKEAFTGSISVLNIAICTLPSSWREVIIKYDWSSSRNADSFMIIPKAGLNTSQPVKPSDNEIGILINATNQVQMTDRGDSGDAIVTGVYYR